MFRRICAACNSLCGWIVALAVAVHILLGSTIVFAQANTVVTNFTAPPVPNAGHSYIGVLDETVNPASGSVSLRINVPTPQGRGGLHFPFSLNYDSNQVISLQPAPLGGNTWRPAPKGGWSVPIPQLSDFESAASARNYIAFSILDTIC